MPLLTRYASKLTDNYVEIYFDMEFDKRSELIFLGKSMLKMYKSDSCNVSCIKIMFHVMSQFTINFDMNFPYKVYALEA